MRLDLLRLGFAAAAALVVAGCAPKVIRERIVDTPGVRVELRHTEEGGKAVAHGYAQPATISDVRIAHILASLVYEDDDKKQTPVVRALYVYDMAAGISKALEKAGPDDEVAAASFPEDKRLGIFTDSKVTALRITLVGDEMRIDVLALEQPLERDGGKIGTREYEIPTEMPTIGPRFKLVPGQAQTRESDRSLNIAWRDPYYRKPANLSFSGGQARRRTVLMELPQEDMPTSEQKAPAELPPNLSDAQLRAIDQLDAARTAGQVREADYQRKRRLILDNKLDEAGYGAGQQ